jgi:Integrase core domain
VLSHSRKAYSEVVYRQTTDDFLRCLESAFRQFGGAPRRLIIDNLRAAVKKADWYDPELNPKVRSFGEYYGFVFLPTRPYMPRHKGKVENSVGYAQDNALKGRIFSSLEEQNGFLREWELTVADTRIHGTTRLQVGKHFADAERETLLPLPVEPFPSYREAHLQPRVRVGLIARSVSDRRVHDSSGAGPRLFVRQRVGPALQLSPVEVRG